MFPDSLAVWALGFRVYMRPRMCGVMIRFPEDTRLCVVVVGFWSKIVVRALGFKRVTGVTLNPRPLRQR